MKITLFTSNKNRHNYLINLLSNYCEELFVIQENNTIFPGKSEGTYKISKLVEKYFKKVNEAQIKIFGNSYVNSENKNIKLLPLASGDLNNCKLNAINDFLKSDIYIVFGSSYIKGDLIDFLEKRETLNIHMGISPFYRGTDCNFWALFDNNPHLVGATIHKLSKGLDSGPILYHALSNLKNDPFEYTMSTVKSAFHSIVERIKDKTIFNIKTTKQDRSKEIRYSKKIDFNEKIVESYLNKKIDLNSKQFDQNLLKDPFFLNN